ncbi:MAG: MATE family efflux transporter [Dehalococcoidales bacterium]|nr:MATE family efflux transporter [Dehalococcoidales bacterium]
MEKNWTEGGVVRNLWSLSWPIMISQTLTVIGPTVDMIWVGKLGAAEIAGVGVSGMVVMAINSLMMGLYTGLRAMIARFVGAGDNASANNVGQQTLVIGVVFSLITAVFGIFFTEPILELFGTEADVVAEGAAYMRIQLAGSITMALAMISQMIMQASGDTVNPMRISIVFRLLHVAICPAMVFGWWIFPDLGVSGAAWANVISQSIGGIVGIWYLFTGRTRLKLTLKGFHLDRDILWRMVKIGVPSSITGFQRFVPYLIIVMFVSPFGTAAVGAHSLMQRIDNFIRMPAGALGNAAGVLAGQNLGAGKPERAEKGGWVAVGLYSGAMVICSILIWFFAENIVHIFSTDPELVRISSDFMRIQIVGYLVFGLTIVISLCVEGVGDTIPTMIGTLITMWAIQVPLAWFLSKHTSLGVNGIQWAISIALVARAVLFTVYFMTGRWKRKKI